MRTRQGVRVWVAGLCAVAIRAGAFDTINWLSSVADGYYSDPANWTGGILPTNGNTGLFTGNQDYVVRFPAGGLAENSVTKVSSLSSGRSVTFDTRGTWWLKAGCDAWPNNWTAFQICANSSHFFNIESVRESNANAYPVMELSNALFRVQYHSTGMTNVLEEGLLNLYNPGGVAGNGHSLITGSYAPANNLILFKTNSMLRANNVRLRGHPNGHLMRFEGGVHEIYNGLTVTEGGASAGTTCTVQIAGGSLTVRSGWVNVGNKVATQGNLVLEGSGEMTVWDTFTVAFNATNCGGAVTLRDNARLAVGGEFQIAQSSKTIGQLRLTNAASLSVASVLKAAYASASTATVDVAGSAALAATGQVTVACASAAYAELALRNSATAYMGGLLVVGDAGGDGVFTLDDNATLAVKGATVIAGGSSGTSSKGSLSLLGGTLEANAVRGGVGSLCRGGTGRSTLRADGATLRAGSLAGSAAFLETFDLAELGAEGLTVDSAGADIAVSQNFADASGTEGLFVKTGAGTLSVSNSVHARTLVAQGGLLLRDSAAAFGRAVTVSNAASLSLAGSAATLTVGDLTLGSAGGMALLTLDVGDCLMVTNSSGLTLNGCGIIFGGAVVNGTYTLFRSASVIDTAVLDKLSLLNPAAGKDYVFTVVPDGSDSTIRLTVSDYTLSDALWDGSESTDWNTANNWTPAALPGYGTRAVFNATAARKTVTLSAPGRATFLAFDSVAPYLLQGEALSLIAGSISNSLGSHTLALPLMLGGAVDVPTAASATTTVSGAVSANLATVISKSGSGAVVVSGDNAGFAGKWKTGGGRLIFSSSSALGSANTAKDALTVSAGTLTYGGAAATVSKGISVDAGDSLKSAILEVASDLTVNGSITNASGILCKRGVGTLTLAAGNVRSRLSSGTGSSINNSDISGTITFPANGDTPATATGLGGFNLLEGTLRLKGLGSGVSIVDQTHFGIIGGNLSACLADPTLELDAVRLNQGGSGQHLIVGNQIPAGSAARSPTVRLINGAYLYVNHLRLGKSSSGATVRPTLIMSNATVYADWQVTVGTDATCSPYVRIMQGSTVSAVNGSQYGGGIYLNRNVDMVVAEGSVIAQTATGGDFRFQDSAANGTVRWESGGTMRFAKFQGRNYQTTDGLNMIFDGGVMEPIASGYSYSTKADKQSFIIEDGGLTVKVPGSIRHELTFPLTGAGALTKTGTGELVFGAGLNYTPSATNLTGLATGDYTGGTTVQEGTLSVSNGTIRADAAVSIAAGARLNLSNGSVTLGEISGSGTVSNGVLSAGYRCHVAATSNDCIALANVTLPAGLTVTFDPAEGTTLTNRQALAVATRSGATELNLASWKAQNVGDKMTATFSLVNDTVYANVLFSGGTLLFFK